VDGGIMVTRSHKSDEYNGMKLDARRRAADLRRQRLRELEAAVAASQARPAGTARMVPAPMRAAM